MHVQSLVSSGIYPWGIQLYGHKQLQRSSHNNVYDFCNILALLVNLVYIFVTGNVEHPNCLALKGKQKSIHQEQEYVAGWGKIDMFIFLTGRNLLWFIPVLFAQDFH